MITLALVWLVVSLYTSLIVAVDAARTHWMEMRLREVEAEFRRLRAKHLGGDGLEGTPSPSPEGAGSEFAGCE